MSLLLQALLIPTFIITHAKYVPPFTVNLDSTLRCEKYNASWSARVELADYMGNMIHETKGQYLHNQNEVIFPLPAQLYGVVETNAYRGLQGIIHHSCSKYHTHLIYVINFYNLSRNSKNEVNLKINLTIDDLGSDEFFDGY